MNFTSLLTRVSLSKVLRPPTCRGVLPIVQRCSSTEAAGNQASNDVEKDPGEYFFHPEIHSLLKKVTSYDEQKIFARQPRKANLRSPKYDFMLKADYEKLVAEYRKKGEGYLQMPPVVKQREEIQEVLSQDPEIKGYDLAKYVFTDITYGTTDRRRMITVREPDGTLRKAHWEERDRINNVYFSARRRLHRTPEMFETAENLDRVLDRKEFLFVLNRACWQYEPDHPTYQWIVTRTYDRIDAERDHEQLLSTRHYGPMVFHLAWKRAIDNLVVDLIDSKCLSDAVDVVRVFYLIHPNIDVSQDMYPDKPLDYLKAYAVGDSAKKGILDLAIQHYEKTQQTSDAVSLSA